MTSLDTIDTRLLAHVVGGKKAASQPAPQSPDDGAAQPSTGGGFEQFLAMLQQGLGNAGTFIGGLQQIVQAISGFAQMFQPQTAAQPDAQSQDAA